MEQRAAQPPGAAGGAEGAMRLGQEREVLERLERLGRLIEEETEPVAERAARGLERAARARDRAAEGTRAAAERNRERGTGAQHKPHAAVVDDMEQRAAQPPGAAGGAEGAMRLGQGREVLEVLERLERLIEEVERRVVRNGSSDAADPADAAPTAACRQEAHAAGSSGPAGIDAPGRGNTNITINRGHTTVHTHTYQSTSARGPNININCAQTEGHRPAQTSPHPLGGGKEAQSGWRLGGWSAEECEQVVEAQAVREYKEIPTGDGASYAMAAATTPPTKCAELPGGEPLPLTPRKQQPSDSHRSATARIAGKPGKAANGAPDAPGAVPKIARRLRLENDSAGQLILAGHNLGDAQLARFLSESMVSQTGAGAEVTGDTSRRDAEGRGGLNRIQEGEHAGAQVCRDPGRCDAEDVAQITRMAFSEPANDVPVVWNPDDVNINPLPEPGADGGADDGPPPDHGPPRDLAVVEQDAQPTEAEMLAQMAAPDSMGQQPLAAARGRSFPISPVNGPAARTEAGPRYAPAHVQNGVAAAVEAGAMAAVAVEAAGGHRMSDGPLPRPVAQEDADLEPTFDLKDLALLPSMAPERAGQHRLQIVDLIRDNQAYFDHSPWFAGYGPPPDHERAPTPGYPFDARRLRGVLGSALQGRSTVERELYSVRSHGQLYGVRMELPAVETVRWGRWKPLRLHRGMRETLALGKVWTVGYFKRDSRSHRWHWTLDDKQPLVRPGTLEPLDANAIIRNLAPEQEALWYCRICKTVFRKAASVRNPAHCGCQQCYRVKHE